MQILRQPYGRRSSAIIMEEGDYSLDPKLVKGEKVDYIFIPECDERYYTKDNPLYWQLIGAISVGEVYFGQMLTYKNKKETSN